MTDTPFVRRMRELDAERQAAKSLSEKVRIGEEIAALIRANHRGEPLQIPSEPFDAKQAQTGEKE